MKEQVDKPNILWSLRFHLETNCGLKVDLFRASICSPAFLFFYFDFKFVHTYTISQQVTSAIERWNLKIGF